MRRMISTKQIEDLNLSSAIIKKVKRYDLPTITLRVDWTESIGQSDIDWDAGVVNELYLYAYLLNGQVDADPYYLNGDGLVIYSETPIHFVPSEVNTKDRLAVFLTNYLVTNGFPEDIILDEFLLYNGLCSCNGGLDLKTDVSIEQGSLASICLFILHVEGLFDAEEDTGIVIDAPNTIVYKEKISNLDTYHFKASTAEVGQITVPTDPEDRVNTSDKTGIEIGLFSGISPSSGSNCSLRVIRMAEDEYGLMFTKGGTKQACSLFMVLPTSDPHVQYQLWNDNGTLKISAGA